MKFLAGWCNGKMPTGLTLNASETIPKQVRYLRYLCPDNSLFSLIRETICKLVMRPNLTGRFNAFSKFSINPLRACSFLR